MCGINDSSRDGSQLTSTLSICMLEDLFLSTCIVAKRVLYAESFSACNIEKLHGHSHAIFHGDEASIVLIYMSGSPLNCIMLKV